MTKFTCLQHGTHLYQVLLSIAQLELHQQGYNNLCLNNHMWSAGPHQGCVQQPSLQSGGLAAAGRPPEHGLGSAGTRLQGSLGPLACLAQGPLGALGLLCLRPAAHQAHNVTRSRSQLDMP